MNARPLSPIEFFYKEVLPRLNAEAVYKNVQFVKKQGRYWRGTCPLHGGDNPTAFSVDTQTLGWTCFTYCGSGSVLAFLNGGQEPKGTLFIEMVRDLAERLGVDSSLIENTGWRARAWNTPEPVQRSSATPPTRQLDPERPPISELTALWNACVGVSEEPDVASWFVSRGLDPEKTDELNLARAIPKGIWLPPWARYKGNYPQSQPWTLLGYRLLVPCYSHTGGFRSLRARCIFSQSETPKSLPPSGYAAKGLLMADALGQGILTKKEVLNPQNAAEEKNLRLIITEGEPDFLTWATRFSDSAEDIPAVWGIMSGSWNEEIASCIPDGTRVIIRTDHDQAGNRYAHQIYKTLSTRCFIMRTRSFSR